MPGGLDQNLVLESMARTAGPPSTVGGVAQSLPQGSMLIGLSPHQYHGALAGEASTASFQASRAPGLAQAYLQEANGTAKGVYQVPTVLQRASQLSQALGMMLFETTGHQTVIKPEDLDEALPQGSISNRESEVLEATPWMSHSPLATDIDHSQEFPADSSQRPNAALGGGGSQLSYVYDQRHGLCPSTVPEVCQALRGQWWHPNSASEVSQQLGAPSSHLVAASGVPGAQTGSVKGTLAHQQTSVSHAVPRSPSMVYVVPQSPSAAHMSRSHSRGMMASTVISGSPKLAHGSTIGNRFTPRICGWDGDPKHFPEVRGHQRGLTRATSSTPGERGGIQRAPEASVWGSDSGWP